MITYGAVWVMLPLCSPVVGVFVLNMLTGNRVGLSHQRNHRSFDRIRFFCFNINSMRINSQVLYPWLPSLPNLLEYP